MWLVEMMFLIRCDSVMLDSLEPAETIGSTAISPSNTCNPLQEP